MYKGIYIYIHSNIFIYIWAIFDKMKIHFLFHSTIVIIDDMVYDK